MNMRTWRNKWTRQMTLAAVIIIALMLLSMRLFFQYSENVRKYATDSSKEQLQDFADHDAQMVENQIMSGVNLLKSVAAEINMYGSEEEVLRALRENKAISGFNTIQYVDRDGNAKDGEGAKTEFQESENLDRVLNGETVIEAQNSGNSMNEEFIQIGTPIIRYGKVLGCIYGKYDAYTIAAIIETNSFQGESYAVLVTQDGEYVVNTTSDKAINTSCENVYDFISRQTGNHKADVDQIREATDNKEKIILNYGSQDNGRVASLVPVGINDWYLVKMVTYTHINANARQIQKMSTTLAIEIILLMVLLGMLILYMVMESHKEKNRTLAEALNTANRATETKSRFLAQMSHEIRTPMNAIIGLTGIAKTDVDDGAKMTDYLDKIDSASRILLGIINDVLDMSAMENNKIQLANEPFNLQEVITAVSNIYYQQCKQKGIDFSVHISRITSEDLVGDVLRINQILYNLLNNAVKFTPAGGHISLKAFQAEGLNQKVHMMFVISDDGCGMSEEMKNRLFQPFEQESATTARKHGGSGLGLSIVKNLITMMHGTIRVESEKEKGTSFHVDIPFDVVENTGNEKSNQKEALAGMRLLIVDEDQDILDYVSLMLTRLEVRHTCLKDGEQALEVMGDEEEQGDAFNVCIVDWKLSNMSGRELTEQIREIFRGEPITIVASAYDVNEIETEGKEAGVDYYMPKPLFQSTLFNLLMKMTSGKYQQSREISTEEKDYHLSGKRILVAEDVALNMEVAIKLLAMQGMQAECAEDGSAAVKLFKMQKPHYYDAILMDINMPIMDGYEATRKIRASGTEDAKIIPIFAMTANAFTEDISACYNAGMNGHVSKPIETKILYETLEKAFIKC